MTFNGNDYIFWEVVTIPTQKILRTTKRIKGTLKLSIKPKYDFPDIVFVTIKKLRINDSFFYDPSMMDGPQSEAIVDMNGVECLLECETWMRRGSLTIMNNAFSEHVNRCNEIDFPGDQWAQSVLDNIIPGVTPSYDVQRALEILKK